MSSEARRSQEEHAGHVGTQGLTGIAYIEAVRGAPGFAGACAPARASPYPVIASAASLIEHLEPPRLCCWPNRSRHEATTWKRAARRAQSPLGGRYRSPTCRDDPHAAERLVRHRRDAWQRGAPRWTMRSRVTAGLWPPASSSDSGTHGGRAEHMQAKSVDASTSNARCTSTAPEA